MAFFRLARTPGPSSLALALASLLLSPACTDKPARSLGFEVAFACDEVRSAASALRIEIRREGCAGDLVRSIDVQRGATPAADGALDPGKYGLVALALGEEGAELGRGCVVANLPAEFAPSVIVDSPLCTLGVDDAGETSDGAIPRDGGTDAAADPDASPDPDTEVDAGPPPECPATCADPDPCTDDSCVNGRCVNTPFDGPRECDGVACTSGDICEAGTCKPGAPDDGLCEQPAGQCQRATCIAGSGCNVGNADGIACNDDIACTSNDRCNAGVCRGSDSCGANRLCLPSTGACISQCSSPSDCDDGLPCTSDVCNAGNCSNPPKSGGECNDVNACTSADTCVTGTCAGTSTCPQGACCVGSVCDCPADTTLCGSACVDLSTSRNHCGVCGRACSNTQTCEGGACKPTSSDASRCTAARDSGHDYLFCTDTQSWNNARNRCSSWGFGLVIIGSASENAFVRSGIGARDAWMAANDSSTSVECRLQNGEIGEGHWYWASATDSNLAATPLCNVTASGPVRCEPVNGAYQNWGAGQPDNSGCTCLGICTLPSGDCGVLQAAGTWDDTACNNSRAYVCESP